MKHLLSWTVAAALLSACGIREVAEDTRREVQKSNDLQNEILTHIKKTSDAVHLQVMTVALQQMLAPENTANLDPPIRMMPYAETFAKEATAEELIKTCYVLLTDAQSGSGDRRTRLASLVAMSAVAALAPAEKSAEILHVQVDEGGRYRDTAYAYTLARYVFTRDFLLTPIVEKTKYLTEGALKEVVTSFNTLKAIRDLPYQSRLVLEIVSLDVDESIPPSELKAIGEKAHRRFQADLDGGVLASLGVQDLLKQLQRNIYLH